MKHIIIFFTVILTSFFFFPIEFVFAPGVNTKMMIAVLGILFFFLNSIGKQKIVMFKEIFIATIIACIFSFIVLYAVIYNNTEDYTYATYIVSMWVWLGGAYAVCQVINRVHGFISVKLVINYLIAVCALQCLSALLIDNIPFVKLLVDNYTSGTVTDSEFLSKGGRLYGIGAALDVAGTRFSAVLVMIAVLLCTDNEIQSNRKHIAMYVFLFVWIAVVGSIMTRTTNVGIIIAAIYLVYATGILRMQIQKMNLKLWGIFIGVTFLLVLLCIYLYNHVPSAQNLLRFGFEGFINWLETGKWRTHSTDILQNMWVFPESWKTWIIGDGYFENPHNYAYKGGGYYMGTDVGYLRFIFYCGLTGLSAFTVFFVYLSVACYRKFPQERELFLLLLVLMFMIWAKVSTDIFLVYALFLCVPNAQKQFNNQMKMQ